MASPVKPHRRLFGLRPPKPERIDVNGAPIRFRAFQNLYWGIGIGLLGVCLVAGGYFALLQVHWFIHIGSFYWPGWSLKHGWDDLFKSPSWKLYRHNAFRDLLEPALFVMAGKTLMAPPKYWDRHVGWARLLLSPPVVVVLAIGMGLAGTWLLYFGLPAKWQAPDWQTLLLGALIGLVLHKFWAPVGATLQGIPVDKSVDRARGRRRTDPDYTPLWVRKPLAPPVLRERWADLMSDETDTDTADPPARWVRWVLIAGVIVAILLIIMGGVAKYYLAHGGTLGFWPFKVTP